MGSRGSGARKGGSPDLHLEGADGLREQDPLTREPYLGPLESLMLLELEEKSLLFRKAQKRAAKGRRGVRRLERLSERCPALCVLAAGHERLEVSPRALSLVARQGQEARVSLELEVPGGVADERLFDVSRLFVEEMRDLVRAALEADDETFPVDAKWHQACGKSRVERESPGICRYDTRFLWL